MKRKKLRRMAILALVLVLLFNTLGAKADTVGATITVNSYDELAVALEQVGNLGTIVINSMIVIPKGSNIGNSSKQVIFKYAGSGYIEFEQDNNFTVTSTVENIIFDGNGNKSLQPLLRARGKIDFNNCEFKRAKDGAVYTGYAELAFTNCIFFSNEGTYGGHLNIGYGTTATLDSCSFSYGNATVRGGGIYIDYSNCYVNLKNCSVTANESVYGAGIYNSGNLTLESTLLYNNHADIGGDDFCSTIDTYDLGSLEDMEQAFKDQNITIKPLSWETSVDEHSGWEYYKLLYTTAIPEPTEPAPQEPSEDPDNGEATPPTSGNDGENQEGETGGNEETHHNEEEQDPEVTPPAEEQEPTPSTPSDAGQGGGSGDVDNSDHSQTDNSQSSSSSNVDNSVSSNSSTVDNSSVVSNTDNSSSISNADNSSSRSERSKTENSNNTSTVNNYYQQESDKQDVPIGFQKAPQPVNVTVPVNVSVPEAEKANTGTTEAPEDITLTPPQQNIKIEAEGVDLVYEYTENGVTISIKASKGAEGTAPAVTPASTATNAPESSQQSPNWVEVVSMLLLAVLVLGEIKDKIKPHKEA